MRQRGRFAGFSLYVSNTTDRRTGYLCYHNKDELPPLDFNINCISHGRFVIFYNERMGGAYPDGSQTSSVFTELCEVTVKGMLQKKYFNVFETKELIKSISIISLKRKKLCVCKT